MLEQEIASAIRFILNAADNPVPYYYSVPEGFLVPSIYFPLPEIESSGDTLTSYSLTYTWFITFFHNDTRDAQELAFKALMALQSRKNLIPLIDETGALTEDGFRTLDPSLKAIDNAVQLTLSWNSGRPYYIGETPEPAVELNFNIRLRTAFDNAVSQMTE